MKRLLGLSAVVILLMCGNTSAEPISAGVWIQTSSTAGVCTDCQIEVTQVSADIVSLAGKYDLVGFAYYDKMGDVYRGATEFKAGNGGDFANTVLEIEAKSSGGTLTIVFQSIKGTIIGTYRTTK